MTTSRLITPRSAALAVASRAAWSVSASAGVGAANVLAAGHSRGADAWGAAGSQCWFGNIAVRRFAHWIGVTLAIR